MEYYTQPYRTCYCINYEAETICSLLMRTLKSFILKIKYIVFTGDNCNTCFGGINQTGINNVFQNSNYSLGGTFISLAYPGHILNL